MRCREIDETIGNAIVRTKRLRAHMQPFHLIFGYQRRGLPNQELGEGIAGQELRRHSRAAVAKSPRAGDVLQRLIGFLSREERGGAAEIRRDGCPSCEYGSTAQRRHNEYPISPLLSGCKLSAE
jgi:hypothetical protein